MSVFEAQRVNIKANHPSFKPGTKEVAGNYITIAENVPCRITGQSRHDRTVLFMLAKYYNQIPGGIHQNYLIELVGTDLVYKVYTEPLWAGGKQHHIELHLVPYK